MLSLVSSKVGKTSVGEHLGFKGEATADEMAKKAARETIVVFIVISKREGRLRIDMDAVDLESCRRMCDGKARSNRLSSNLYLALLQCGL